ncbi:MAG: hypothetical protein JNJ90_12770 [Saprospiraceae bacterium]|nr:hypothetical protein [Saprospiraceae bacterium]
MHMFALLLIVQFTAFSGGEEKIPVSCAQSNAPRDQAHNMVFQSADNGKTWRDVSAGLPEDLPVAYMHTAGDMVFAGSRDAGLYSSNAPETGVWQREEIGAGFLNGPLTGIFPGRKGPYATFAGEDPDNLLVQGGLYRKIPETGKWKSMHSTLKAKTVETVLEMPDGALLVGCNNGIFKSADDGKTWKHVYTEGRVLSLATMENVLLASVRGAGVLRSTDSGKTWNWALNDGGAANKVNVVEGHFALFGMTRRVRQSADNGQTWKPMDSEGLPLSGVVYELGQVGKYLFCCHNAGIYRSADGGKNWELVRRAPDAWETGHQLSGQGTMLQMRVSGRKIYAGNVAGGC